MRVAFGVDAVVLTAALLLAAGVLTAGFAQRLRLPGLLIFLGIGMLVGDDGLGVFSLADPEVAQTAGVLALVVILYEGGLTTKPTDLRRAAGPGFALATVGTLVTAGVVAGGAILLTGLDPVTALLVGAVVSSTDAAAVFSLLRSAPLPRKVTALLEVESGANDPLAVLLTIGVLEAWQRSPGTAEWVVFATVQLVGGLVVGGLVGVVGFALLRRVRLPSTGLYAVLALTLAGVAYGTAAELGASGFLAVYVAGLLIGAKVPRYRRGIRDFHESLANVAEIGLFLLLGLLVFPSQLPAVAGTALVVAGVLIVAARPVAVAVTLAPWLLRRRFGAREYALVSWTGLRGAVPIVLATFPLTAAYPDGQLIFDTVFFVVLTSTLLQGASVGTLARWLGLQGTARWSPVAEALPLDGVDADLIEVDVSADLHVAGRRLRDVPLPAGALLVVVVRGSRTLVPTGTTRLEAGDLAVVAVPRGAVPPEAMTAWARGEAAFGHGPVSADEAYVRALEAPYEA